MLDRRGLWSLVFRHSLVQRANRYLDVRMTGGVREERRSPHGKKRRRFECSLQVSDDRCGSELANRVDWWIHLAELMREDGKRGCQLGEADDAGYSPV